MIASQGPEVIGVTGCDDPSAEAHGSGNHEGVNGVTRVQAITMAKPTGEPCHSVAHRDRPHPVPQYAIYRRLGLGATIGLR
jgi:hypothetical protein